MSIKFRNVCPSPNILIYCCNIFKTIGVYKVRFSYMYFNIIAIGLKFKMTVWIRISIFISNVNINHWCFKFSRAIFTTMVLSFVAPQSTHVFGTQLRFVLSDNHQYHHNSLRFQTSFQKEKH